jgi:hypothetical protein
MMMALPAGRIGRVDLRAQARFTTEGTEFDGGPRSRKDGASRGAGLNSVCPIAGAETDSSPSGRRKNGSLPSCNHRTGSLPSCRRRSASMPLFSQPIVVYADLRRHDERNCGARWTLFISLGHRPSIRRPDRGCTSACLRTPAASSLRGSPWDFVSSVVKQTVRTEQSPEASRPVARQG